MIFGIKYMCLTQYLNAYCKHPWMTPGSTLGSSRRSSCGGQWCLELGDDCTQSQLSGWQIAGSWRCCYPGGYGAGDKCKMVEKIVFNLNFSIFFWSNKQLISVQIFILFYIILETNMLWLSFLVSFARQYTKFSVSLISIVSKPIRIIFILWLHLWTLDFDWRYAPILAT